MPAVIVNASALVIRVLNVFLVAYPSTPHPRKWRYHPSPRLRGKGVRPLLMPEIALRLLPATVCKIQSLIKNPAFSSGTYRTRATIA